MQLQLKVCGLRDPANVRAVAELGPDYLGFIFCRQSPRFVGERFVLDRAALLGKQAVGVFVNQELDEVIAAARGCALDGVQLHGDETAGYCRALRRAVPQAALIKAIRVGGALSPGLLAEYAEVCDFFLFDTASRTYGGSGQQFDWQLLADYAGPLPFFLSGGVGAEAARRIGHEFQHPYLHGVDINSRVESAPGVKCPEQVAEVLRILRGV